MPWRWLINTTKSTEIESLLPHNESRNNTIGASMWSLSLGFAKDWTSAHGNNTNGICLAHRLIGYWLTRTFPTQYRIKKIMIIVGIDNFSNWIEAKNLVSTIEFQSIKILRIHIFSKYALSKILISDNGPQFAFLKKKDKWFYEELHINHQFVSVHYSQTNYQVKADDNTILSRLKKSPQS